MKKLAAVLLTAVLAVPAQAIPLDTALDNASHKFDVLWDSFIVDSELDWFANRGAYAQCLHTQNVPNNTPAGPAKEEMPITDRHNHHSFKESCDDIFGHSNINRSMPFAIAVHVYNGPQGKGFVGVIWVKHDGVEYTLSRNYGPETWRTQDWAVITEMP